MATVSRSFTTQYTEALPQQRKYHPVGAARKLIETRDPVILLDGPAGTGKTRALLEKALLFMELYPGIRVLLLRKTRKSLTQSAMVTWEQKVLPVGWQNWIPFHTTDQEYRHANGSIMAVAGLDDPAKIMSTEWDVIVVPEATELTEAEFEALTIRNRNFAGGMQYQQIIMDCNPQGPKHWLNVRCDKPKDAKNPRGPRSITRIKSRHKDNPEYWDERLQTWTDKGRTYLTALRALTGVRFYRFFKGLWRQAEGIVFDNWNADVHLIYRRQVPDSWRRYWGVDFGYDHAFCWQEWALDEDKRAYLIQQIYFSGRTIRQHALTILQATNNIAHWPVAVVCDHDAQGRATLEEELGITTTPAYKVKEMENVEAIKNRLKRAGDGLPRLYIMRDSLVELDHKLEEKALPTCTEDEFDGYVMDIKSKKIERPLDENDHGMKAMEYVIGYIDGIGIHAPGGVTETTRSKG